jgi:hypothetical protein
MDSRYLGSNCLLAKQNFMGNQLLLMVRRFQGSNHWLQQVLLDNNCLLAKQNFMLNQFQGSNREPQVLMDSRYLLTRPPITTYY